MGNADGCSSFSSWSVFRLRSSSLYGFTATDAVVALEDDDRATFLELRSKNAIAALKAINNFAQSTTPTSPTASLVSLANVG